MNKPLSEISQLLSSRRREKNLSLQDVEAATAIKRLFLEAIEEGNLESLGPKQVYAIGFMRAYAEFLGIDASQVAYAIPEQKFEFSYGIGTVQSRKGFGGKPKWLPNLIWGGVALTMLILAWYFARVVGLL
ncbi:MAG: hypothetical protein K940chlam2_00819 [Chlamydiae bacterium]|nr:hypothetical protein [Chlamydiota bacterium]